VGQCSLEDLFRKKMDYQDIYDIGVEVITKYPRYELLVGHEIDIGNANERQVVGLVPFKKWKVIGLGLFCIEATTDGEAPVLQFGDMSDDDMYGIFTITAAAGKGMHASEYSSVEVNNFFAADDFDADAPVYAWSEAGTGSKYNVEQAVIGEITIIEAATVGMSSGKFIPYALVYIDKGGAF